MKNQGKEDHDFTMRNVSAGWHVGEFESVEDFTNPRNDKRSLILRIKVTEGDDTGLNASMFCAWETDRADKMIASVLLAVGLQEAFNKAFPGADVTYFDKKVIEKLMQKLPGMGCKFLIEEDKNGFANVAKVYNLKTDVTKIPAKGGKAAAEKSEKSSDKKAEAAGTSEDW
jgi:hypothetical protein